MCDWITKQLNESCVDFFISYLAVLHSHSALQACWCVIGSEQGSGQLCWACAGSLGGEGHSQTPERTRWRNNTLIHGAGPSWGGLGHFGRLCWGPGAAKHCSALDRKSQALVWAQCASTLLPASVWKVPVLWLQGILSSSKEGVTLLEPLWTQWNLCIIGLIPFDSAFTHQKRPGEAGWSSNSVWKGQMNGFQEQGTPHPAGGTGTVVGELLPPIPACPWQQQHQLVSLPPTAAEISVNQSYRVELSQSQGKALALIHQLKMSKAFEPDWNLPKTNKQKCFPKSLLSFYLILVKSFIAFSSISQIFSLLFLQAWLYKCIPVQMYILDAFSQCWKVFLFVVFSLRQSGAKFLCQCQV